MEYQEMKFVDNIHIVFVYKYQDTIQFILYYIKYIFANQLFPKYSK